MTRVQKRQLGWREGREERKKGGGGGQIERKGFGIGEQGDHLLTVLKGLGLTKQSNTAPKFTES